MIQKKNLEKDIAVLLMSTIMSKLELEAILQLLQVMERPNSSKIYGEWSIQGPVQKSKIKMQIIFTFYE